jgi:hypothetical protein
MAVSSSPRLIAARPCSISGVRDGPATGADRTRLADRGACAARETVASAAIMTSERCMHLATFVCIVISFSVLATYVAGEAFNASLIERPVKSFRIETKRETSTCVSGLEIT